MIRDRSRLTKVAATGMLLAALAAAPSGASRPNDQPVEARNGAYGGFDGDQQAFFRIQNRRVSELAFNLRISCTNTDDGQTYDRYFSADDLAGGRVRANGLYRHDFEVESDFRTGQVNVEIDFRNSSRRPLTSFAVIVPGPPAGVDSCSGFTAIRTKRGG
jgi:hypothetical protein